MRVRHGAAAAAAGVALRRWRVLLVAGAALAALGARVPAALRVERHFPAHHPADIAHDLADISHQPGISGWRVTEDRSNYTTWQYSVEYACGARCSGRASVHAHALPPAPPAGPAAPPQHGRASRHRVLLAARACSALPLLPWPQLCDELEIEAVVSSDEAAGARLQLEWRTRCGALGWLAGACQRALRRHCERRLAALPATV